MVTSGNLISFIIVLILTQFAIKGDLILLGTIISAVPVILFVSVSIISFRKNYRLFSPSLKEIDIHLSRGLLNLGAKFFFMQVSAIIIFSTSNIFITQFYGPDEVVVFNIAFKYFQLPVMVFAIVVTPFWSAVTDAYVQSDYKWLKNTLRKLNLLSLLFSLGVILMVFISKWAYEIWIGSEITIPLTLSVCLGIYTITRIINAPYSSYINGIGKIKVAMISTFFEVTGYFIFIFIFKNIFGNSTAIVVAMILTGMINFILNPIQIFKLLNKTATGVWNK